jgi:predicted PurR-regulated permease PerM
MSDRAYQPPMHAAAESGWPHAASLTSGSGPSFFYRLLMITGMVVIVALVWMARDALLVIFGGILFGVFLSGLTNLLTTYAKSPRWLALSIVVVVLAALVVGGFWFLGAKFLGQIGALEKSMNQGVAQMQAWLAHSPIAKALPSMNKGLSASFDSLGAVFNYVTTGAEVLAVPVGVLIVGFYSSIKPDVYERSMLILVPPARRERTREILREARQVLWGWIWGRLTAMAIIAGTTFVGLWLLGVPLAFALSLIAFITNFVPYIGPIISGIPALIIALTVSPWEVAYVALLYLGIHLLEANIVSPLIAQHSVKLPPAFTLGMQLVFGVILGPLGLLFATPLAAVGVTLVKLLYIEDVLGEPPHLGHVPRVNQPAAPGT